MSSAKSSSKKKRKTTTKSGAFNGDDEDKAPYYCPKRLRDMEPDVKVIVGGTEFLHYSVELALNSEYFDAMFASNMKEGLTKVVNFPDKDPNEWKQVYQFLSPSLSKSRMPSPDNEETLVALVPWFSELRMMDALRLCDEAFEETMLDLQQEWQCSLPLSAVTELVLTFLEKLKFSALYDLSVSAATGEKIVLELFKTWPYLVALSDRTVVDRFIALVKSKQQDGSAQEEDEGLLAEAIKYYLPREHKSIPLRDLVRNPLLPAALLFKIGRHPYDENVSAIMDTHGQSDSDMPGTNDSDDDEEDDEFAQYLRDDYSSDSSS